MTLESFPQRRTKNLFDRIGNTGWSKFTVDTSGIWTFNNGNMWAASLSLPTDRVRLNLVRGSHFRWDFWAWSTADFFYGPGDIGQNWDSHSMIFRTNSTTPATNSTVQLYGPANRYFSRRVAIAPGPVYGEDFMYIYPTSASVHVLVIKV